MFFFRFAKCERPFETVPSSTVWLVVDNPIQSCANLSPFKTKGLDWSNPTEYCTAYAIDQFLRNGKSVDIFMHDTQRICFHYPCKIAGPACLYHENIHQPKDKPRGTKIYQCSWTIYVFNHGVLEDFPPPICVLISMFGVSTTLAQSKVANHIWKNGMVRKDFP